jgi:hypothetical protein
MSKSLYQKIESCDRRPQRDFAVMCDEVFSTPGVFTCIYEDMITEPFPAWFGPRVTYEDRAAVITDREQRGIPGLLQTEDYARAVIRACRPFDPPEALEHEVRSRLDRQDILGRESPPKRWVVIAEGVLRQHVGSEDVMAAQLDHLLKVAGSPGAVIQVLPFSAADAPGADGPAALFEFREEQPVAYLEGWGTGRVVEEPKDVAAIATALSMIKGCAMSPGDSEPHGRDQGLMHGQRLAHVELHRRSGKLRRGCRRYVHSHGSRHQGPRRDCAQHPCQRMAEVHRIVESRFLVPVTWPDFAHHRTVSPAPFLRIQLSRHCPSGHKFKPSLKVRPAFRIANTAQTPLNSKLHE